MALDIPSDSPGGDREGIGPRPPEFSNRSNEVLTVLRRQEGRAEDFFEGALLALRDPVSKVGPELAAYALREVIEELERAATVVEKGPKLGDLLDRLVPKWKAAERRPNDGGLVDPCDAAVFAVDNFLEDAEQGRSSRRNRAQETLEGLDPVGREGPPDTRTERVEALLRFRREFNEALHGADATDLDVFRKQLHSFERFLLDWFRPSTFANFDAIDELLEDGPPE